MNRYSNPFWLAVSFVVMFVVWPCITYAENWPEFRGPGGQGHAGDAALPIEWDVTTNVAWKQAIPGKGWSSPIFYDGRLYVTTSVSIERADSESADNADSEAAENAAPLEQAMQLHCLDASSGEFLWESEVFRKDMGAIHSKNSHASPTPITDGKRLYVHFGPYGTAALDFDGEITWSIQDNSYDPVHGTGGSPILSDGLLVFSCDGGDQAYVVALDCATGEACWKTDRPAAESHQFSFSTPLEITVDGGRQIVSPGSHGVSSYDAKTGREIWRVNYPNKWSIVPRPVLAHGLIFVCTGYSGPASLLAIRPDGTGDVTETHVQWQTEENVPYIPSPIVVADSIYMVSDAGVASCRDARTGDLHWRERLGGHFSSSPLFANDKIYFQSEEGECVVIQVGHTYQELRRNSLDELTQASYAVGQGAIFIRTLQQLYRIN